MPPGPSPDDRPTLLRGSNGTGTLLDPPVVLCHLPFPFLLLTLLLTSSAQRYKGVIFPSRDRVFLPVQGLDESSFDHERRSPFYSYGYQIMCLCYGWCLKYPGLVTSRFPFGGYDEGPVRI